MPTHDQTRPRAAVKSAGAPSTTTSKEHQSALNHANSNLSRPRSGQGHARVSSTASSKRSSDGEDRSSVKKRRVIGNGGCEVTMDDEQPNGQPGEGEGDVKAKSDRPSEATQVSGDNKSTGSVDWSIIHQDDSDKDCDHDRFERHDGVSSFGLWPCYALICACEKKIIQARGSSLLPIGHGESSRM